MSVGSKAFSVLVVAGGCAAAAVTWPSYIEPHFSGFTERSQPLRSMLPWASKEAPTAQGGGGRPGGAPRSPQEARQAAIAARPPVPIDTDIVKRGPVPLRVDAVGSVQPIASVALKTRIDAQIDKIFVNDGAVVKEGEVLVQLDSRQIAAQIKQTEANIAKDNAALEGASRDMARTTELVGRGAGTQLAADNARTALAAAKASLAADQALLENQKVQLSWYTLTAPITGRVGTFTAKAGNIIRSGDNSATGSLASIVQTTPIYVAFSVPQAVLSEIREALVAGQGEVTATPQGSTRSAKGKIAVLDNTIDASTGTITLRGIFDNADDLLWPGQLCNLRVTLRTESDVVSIPRTATLSGQNGNFVYIIENGLARLRAVKVGRFQDGRDIILEGLKGGETVASDGGLLLVDGVRVDVKNKAQDKKGAT